MVLYTRIVSHMNGRNETINVVRTTINTLTTIFDLLLEKLFNIFLFFHFYGKKLNDLLLTQNSFSFLSFFLSFVHNSKIKVLWKCRYSQVLVVIILMPVKVSTRTISNKKLMCDEKEFINFIWNDLEVTLSSQYFPFRIFSS